MKTEEIVGAVRVLFSLMKELVDEEALAAIIVTESAYPKLRRFFGEQAEVFRPGGLHIDENMENGFIVNGLIILRGRSDVLQ